MPSLLDSGCGLGDNRGMSNFNILSHRLLISILVVGCSLASGVLCRGVREADEHVSSVRAGQDISFNRDIRPILSEHCFTCHGPDKNTREADLRLDIRDHALEAGALDSDDWSSSELLQRIFSDDPDEMMPPPSFLKPLNESQRELLKQWVKAGAIYEDHWAYVPPQKVPVPPNANGIDYWIDEGLKKAGLAAAPPADRQTLLRRVTLDLTGLPPTLAEQNQFLHDDSPDAYERMVDRLIAAPQFGERMASGWLDVVRYADTVGYHGDQNQNVFPYRDWVVEAFNRNLPFDQFTLWQIAGDQIDEPTTESLIASAFNRLNMMTREGGAQPEEYLAKYAADRVRTVSGAWLGSTMGCAECHDHKYDPFTMEDFYGMAAFFADLRQWGVYQDYHYTPNPDLRGWSNDHPFPPEIVVEVPYLQQRIERLHSEREKLIAERLTQTAHTATDWSEWQQTLRDFLTANPDGWMRHDPAVVETEGVTGEISANGSLVLSGDKIDKLTYSISPVDYPIATVSLEILSDPADETRLFSNGQMQLGVSFEVETQGVEARQPIRIEFADANQSLPRYANTFEILGIQGGWRIDSSMAPVARGVWLLSEPLRLQPNQTLRIKLTGNRARQWRVLSSPLMPERANHPVEWREQLEGLATQLPSPALATPFAQRQWIFSVAEFREIKNQVRQIEREIRECRDGRWPVQVSQSDTPRETRILPRGDWQDMSGDVVLPMTPHFLPRGELPVSTEERRLTRIDLARWLVAPENPLTPRVQMNRLWKHFFGNGLSPVLDDLGIQGQYPSHPELLDWLALEFRTGGWDVKRMVKLIVMSDAYQRASVPTDAHLQVDPRNVFLARQNARRLEAEAVRDNALAVSGLLNLEFGGPAVFPYQPDNYYEHLQFPDRRYVANRDERQYRRGLYMHWQRTFLHPMLANFDAPSREECTALRIEANTPQQALTLLNDPTFVEAARVLAAKVIKGDDDDQERLRQLYQIVLTRQPTDREQGSLQQFLHSQREHYRSNVDDAQKLLQTGIAATETEIDAAELAAWTQVCRAILNLHETITRY